ncbi:MAG: head-tail connector protein [Lawsonibacter sp.]|nr:head-tail connector protein [Lawsonibacter sp.]
MALTDARKASLMAYCRIDILEDGENALLEGFYNAAVAYLGQAGVKEPDEGTPRRAQYDLAVNYLVLDAYDNRGSQSPGTSIQDNPAFRRMLTQLKLTDSVSNPDT